jgi:hypothetical protein
MFLEPLLHGATGTDALVKTKRGCERAPLTGRQNVNGVKSIAMKKVHKTCPQDTTQNTVLKQMSVAIDAVKYG